MRLETVCTSDLVQMTMARVNSKPRWAWMVTWLGGDLAQFRTTLKLIRHNLRSSALRRAISPDRLANGSKADSTAKKQSGIDEGQI